MIQLIVKCTVLFVLVTSFSQATHAQRIFVDVQPQARAVPRPLAPRSNYVWIDGEWVRRGRHYVYQPGYWASPRAGWVWMPGRWIRERRGWYWTPGSWKRVQPLSTLAFVFAAFVYVFLCPLYLQNSTLSQY